MANISDITEQFILLSIGEDASILIFKNQLAQHFNFSKSNKLIRKNIIE